MANMQSSVKKDWIRMFPTIRYEISLPSQKPSKIRRYRVESSKIEEFPSIPGFANIHECEPPIRLTTSTQINAHKIVIAPVPVKLSLGAHRPRMCVLSVTSKTLGSSDTFLRHPSLRIRYRLLLGTRRNLLCSRRSLSPLRARHK